MGPGAGLRGNVARNNLARFWVEGNLAAAKKEPSAGNRLGIGTNRLRGFACRNDFFHAADCSCKLLVHNEHDKATAQKNSQGDPERSERAHRTRSITQNGKCDQQAIERSLASFGMTD